MLHTPHKTELPQDSRDRIVGISEVLHTLHRTEIPQDSRDRIVNISYPSPYWSSKVHASTHSRNYPFADYNLSRVRILAREKFVVLCSPYEQRVY